MEICRDAALCAAWARASGVEKILPEEAAGRLELCFFAAGETLCNEGDEAAALQFVLCGRYKLIRLTRAGQECLLRFFDAFSLIGELELLQGGPSRTTAVALGPLVCLRLSAVSVQLSGLQDRAAQPEPHPDARRAGAAADGELSAGHRAKRAF